MTKPFLLLSISDWLLLPIAANAETWITIYSDYDKKYWPEEAF